MGCIAFFFIVVVLLLMFSSKTSSEDKRINIKTISIDDLDVALSNELDTETPTDSTGKTLLISAAVSGRADIVKLLLQYGANIEAKDYNGENALIKAAREGIYDDLSSKK